MIYTSNPYIDAVLTTHQTALGKQYDAYHNHVYRVYNLTLQLNEATKAEQVNLAIAAAFHDMGIWTAKTFDYLVPSILLATEYAAQHHADAGHIAALINNHHKLTTYKTDTVVEAFRKADLIDLSVNLFRFGVKRSYLRELNKAFPGKGFHRFILGQIVKNILRHPLNPLPIVRF